MVTSNNTKARARQFQAETGVNYTTALREVMAAPAAGTFDESAAAKDPATSPVVLNDLARMDIDAPGADNGFLREKVAANPSTPEATLRWLADVASINDSGVEDGLLRNPATPPDILRRFMLRDGYARMLMAKNPAATEDMIMAVIEAEPKLPDVEYWASENVALSEELRQRIIAIRTTDSWKRFVAPEVAEALRHTYRGWLSLQEDRDDPIGDVARDARDDASFPDIESQADLDRYLEHTEAHQAATSSWAEFQAQLPT